MSLGGEHQLDVGPYSCFPVGLVGLLTHKVVVCAHTVVICVCALREDPLLTWTQIAVLQYGHEGC